MAARWSAGWGSLATPPLQAAALAGSAALAIYLLTLAPTVTFWDSGEFLTAAQVLGIPHPPGTPLYVVIARSWSVLLAPLTPARAINLLSAVSTAAAVALVAALLARWLRSRLAAVAGAIVAGTMASVWDNATEAEVYALALLLAVATIFVADRTRIAERRDAALILVSYLLALAVSLHPFALVAAPAALVLAATDEDGRPQWGAGAMLLGALLVAMGAAMVSPAVAIAGGLLLACAWWFRARPRSAVMLTTLALVLALTPLTVMLVRARHDPPLNQGNPASLGTLVDVVARRQYAVAPIWPRRAPPWLQAGNVVGWGDWQVARGLAPDPPPSWRRTPFTLLFVVLAVYGALVHRRRHRRSWLALLVLLVAGTLGAAAQLNLRAGPSVGGALLSLEWPREPRERDYFFIFGFWAWGAWAGAGAVELARRFGRPFWGLPVAALPIVLNWRDTDRAHGPDATLARDVAQAMLADAPPRALLLTAGDNDTYPLWYLQQVEGVRRDVTVLVTAMLPAGWYRAEIARRDTIGARLPRQWIGMERTIAAIAADARARGRPVVASPLLPAELRSAARGGWTFTGARFESRSGAPSGSTGKPAIDAEAAAATAARMAHQVGSGTELPASSKPAARMMRRVLACAPLAVSAAAAGGASEGAGADAATPDSAPATLLATWCNWR